ncbi:hypothetical protein PFISCL1PPCAC_13378, partial [Pristionchus fissidentatus]
SDDFGIASSGRGSPSVYSEDSVGDYVKRLMKVIGSTLPRQKRAVFIQIMRNLSGGKESLLLAILKLIELFGKNKEKVAEFECIIPQDDLDRFYQILNMHEIAP